MLIFEGIISLLALTVLFVALLFIAILTISLAWNYGKHYVLDKYYEDMEEF